jgi:hypothetical protein
MRPSDADLETRLRGLRARAAAPPPPPPDLVDSVRSRYRAARGRRLRLAGACLAVGLLLATVPVMRSTVLADGGGAASPAPATPTARPALLDLPPRGSLAQASDWLADVAALDWGGAGTGVPDPPVADRQVAYTGDVAGLRVALVLAPGGGGTVRQAWFAGPAGADAGELTLLQQPSSAGGSGPLTMWDVPDPAAPRAVLVVVASPRDRVEVRTGRTVTADGETQDRWEPVPVANGAGAVAVDAPATWQHSAEVRITRDGETLQPVLPQFSARAVAAEAAVPVDVADPRGLWDTVAGGALELAVHDLTGTYGATATQLGLTLLAGGPVGGTSTGVVLVGATFPSGATVARVGTYELGAGSAAGSVGVTGTAPAGTALLDRVLAIGVGDVLVVSGPRVGVVAQVITGGGALLSVLPLADGAGAGRVPGAGADSVRILDRSGALVAARPIEEPG